MTAISETLLNRFVELFQVWEEALPVLQEIVMPDEIQLIVALNGETLDFCSIANRMNLPENKLRDLLESAFQRYLIHRIEEDSDTRYCQTSFGERLNCFVKFENWLDLEPAIRRKLDHRCLDEYTEKQRSRIQALRAGIQPEEGSTNDAVLLLDEVESIINQSRLIAVQPCDCRLLGQNCNRMTDVCLIFNQEAENLLARKKGKQLSKSEAIDLVQTADKNGLMHTGDPKWQQNGLKAICNCCGCDCYPFRGAKLLDSKGIWPESRYLARVDQSKCDYCGICTQRCYFGAFIKSDKKVTIKGKQRYQVLYDPEKCRGCGLCTSTCKSGAIKMNPIN